MTKKQETSRTTFVLATIIISLLIGFVIGVLLGVALTKTEINEIKNSQAIKDTQKVIVVCDNQNIWDNRGKIRNFKCECDNIGCRNFPSKRTCIAGIWVFKNNQTNYIETKITCTEIKV